MLAAEPAAELISRIEQKLGFQVHRLRYVSQMTEESEAMPVLSDEELEKLVSAIQAAPTTKVMLVVAEGAVMVLPYQEK